MSEKPWSPEPAAPHPAADPGQQPATPQPHVPEESARHKLLGSRASRGLLVGGLVVGLAAGGAGVAFAASSGTSTTTPGTTPATAPGPGFGHRGGGPGFARGGPGTPGMGGAVIHGQYTVPDGTNSFQTDDIQVGKASAVSANAITVTSADNFSHPYVVTANTIVDSQRDGIATVANGDEVRVLATTSKTGDTATSVMDMTKLAASGFGRNQPRGGPDAPVPPGSPSPTTAAPGSTTVG